MRTSLRKEAAAIFQAGLKAVNPVHAVRRHLQLQDDKLTVNRCSYDLKTYQRIFVVGMGKASAAMAQPLEEILGHRLNAGTVNVKYGHTVPLNVIQIHEAGHPVPDQQGLRGAQQMVQLLQQAGEKDLVFCLISGGGSALLPLPSAGLTLEDIQNTTKILLECGATIHEINAIRKHVSQIKGGRLARLTYPAALVSLILSDVIGNNLDTIASGPTVPDHSTFTDCLHILKKYDILGKIPPSVYQLLKKGAQGKIEETPKPDDSAFTRAQNVIIGSSILAVEAAKKKSDELGYHSLIISTFIQGESREIAKMHTAMAKEIISSRNPVPRPACIISGGETTVTLRGTGLGGRNQEFVLAAAMEIDGWEGVVILSGGTDGTDGPTDAAGAVADGSTIVRAKELGLDAEQHLRSNDSYHFFQPLDDLIMTGPTFTNVMDLRLVMVG
ncbi:MAG: glycerate kinase [Candidatus Aminicenantes bacterium]